MPRNQDGPRSPLFNPITLNGNASLPDMADLGVSEELAKAYEHAPVGDCVAWGIPFEVGDVVALSVESVSVELPPIVAPWLVFYLGNPRALTSKTCTWALLMAQAGATRSTKAESGT